MATVSESPSDPLAVATWADEGDESKSERYLSKRLKAAGADYKGVAWTTFLLAAGVAAMLWLALGVTLEHWIVRGGLPGWARWSWLGIALVAFMVAAWRWVVPLVRYRVNLVYAARVLEQEHPELHNDVVNAVLARAHADETAPLVVKSLRRRAARQLSSVPADGVIDRTLVLRLAYALAALILMAVVYELLAPKSLLVSASRLVAPWLRVAAPARVRISTPSLAWRMPGGSSAADAEHALPVVAGAATLVRGRQVTLSSEIRGLAAGERPVVTATPIRDAGGNSASAAWTVPMVQGAAGTFTAVLPDASRGLDQSVELVIAAGDARSLPVRVAVVDEPSLLVREVRYDYPEYTGQADETVAWQGDIRAIEGTQVTLLAESNHPLEAAWIDFDGDSKRDVPLVIGQQDLARGRGSFTLRLNADRSAPEHAAYRLMFQPKSASSARREPAISDKMEYRIEVIPDLMPEISIEEPAEKVVRVPPGAPVSVRVRAVDPDFGLTSVTVETRLKPGAERPGAELLVGKSRKTFRGAATLVPEQLGAGPGMVLEYRAVAKDGRPGGPNVAMTDWQALRIDASAPPREPPPQADEERRDGEGDGQPAEDGKMPPDADGAPRDGDAPDGGDAPEGRDGDEKGGKSGEPSENNAGGDSGRQPDGGQGDSKSPDGGQKQGDQKQGGKGGDEGGDAAEQSKPRLNDPKQGEKQGKPQEGEEQGGGEGGKSQDSAEGKAGKQPGQNESKGKSSGEGAEPEGQGGAGQSQGGKPGDRTNGGQGAEQKPGGPGQQGAGQQGNDQKPGAQQGNSKPNEGKPGAGSGQGQSKDGAPQKSQRGGKGDAGGNASKEPPQGQVGERGKPAPKNTVASDGTDDGEAMERILQHRRQSQPGEKGESPERGGEQKSKAGEEGGDKGDAGEKSQPQEGGGPDGGEKPQGGAKPDGGEKPDAGKGQPDAGMKPDAGAPSNGGSPDGGAKPDAGGQPQAGDQPRPGAGQKPAGQSSGQQQPVGQQPGQAPTGQQQTGGKSPDEDSGSSGSSGQGDSPAGGEGQTPGKGQGQESKAGGAQPGHGEPGNQSQGASGEGEKQGAAGPGEKGGRQKADGAGSESKPGDGEGAGDKRPDANGAGSQGSGKKGAQGEKGAGEKGAGEKGAGEKGAGEKGAGEKGAGEKGAGEKGAGEKGAGEGTPGGEGQGENGATAGDPTQPGSGSQAAPGSESGAGGWAARGDKGAGGEGGPPPERQDREMEWGEQDLANARNAADLAIEHLRESVEAGRSDVLDDLGWTPAQARAFLDRWAAMKRMATSGDARTRGEFDRAVKSLGLRPTGVRSSRDVPADVKGGQAEGRRSRPPSDYREQFKAFMQAAGDE